MALAKIKNRIISKRQRLAFYQFIINVYALNIDMLKIMYNKLDDEDLTDLKYYGFCLMIYEYFGLSISTYNMEALFPELYAYKPANRPNDGWWFTLGGEQTERLEIARKILKSLQEEQ